MPIRTIGGNPTEKEVEDYFVKEVKAIGGICLKWPAVGQKGVPDRIAITPQLGTVFCEIKRLGGKTTKLQEHTMQKIKSAGGICMVIYGHAGVNAFIDFAMDYKKELENAKNEGDFGG